MSVVGTCTTSSHGTAHTRSPFHDYLERLRVVDANGEERIYDKRANKQEWAVAVSSFGLLGVVVEAWVRLENYVKAVDFTAWKTPMDDFFPNDPTDAAAKANLLRLFNDYDGAIFTWVRCACVRACFPPAAAAAAAAACRGFPFIVMPFLHYAQVPMNGAKVTYSGPIPKSYTWNIHDDRITLRLSKVSDCLIDW
jgi:hypothetical protein